MKVRLLTSATIEDFVLNHANGKKHFDKWLEGIKTTDWLEPVDITHWFNANLLGSNRVVFDIGGNGRNAFRMICTYDFGRKFVQLYVNWIGTHEEYNRLTNEVKMTVWAY